MLNTAKNLDSDTELAIVLSFLQKLSTISDTVDLTNSIQGLMNALEMNKGFFITTINKYGACNLLLTDENLKLSTTITPENIAPKTIINDWIVKRILDNGSPILFDIQELLLSDEVPLYVHIWKTLGIRRITATALQLGKKNFGILWMIPGKVRVDLLKMIGGQFSLLLGNFIHFENNIQSLDNNQKLQISPVENTVKMITKSNPTNYPVMIGSSDKMKEIYNLVKKVTKTDSSVLIMGETGTGKELIANAIHTASSRKNHKMIKINCAALPPNLIESELFGHELGSFTGATEQRKGKFELANNSTLFLDEIGELPLDLQAKLLRVLQEKEIERIGGNTIIKINVRIIAATNVDLIQEINKGTFRMDLFFRINVFPIFLPPLREHKDDIPELAYHFLKKYLPVERREKVAFSSKVIKQLKACNWPGNIRELEHLIERTLILNTNKVINHIILAQPSENEENPGYIPTIDEVERNHIVMVLKKCNGKVGGIGGAAEILQIPSTTLNSKIRRLNIKKEHCVI